MTFILKYRANQVKMYLEDKGLVLIANGAGLKIYFTFNPFSSAKSSQFVTT